MERREAWIALDLIPHVGPRTIMRLLEVFEGPERILCAGPAALAGLGFLTRPQIDALAAGADMGAVKKVVRQLAESGAYWICLDDADYPAPLKEIADPPSVLYVRGELKDVPPAVAIVGTRAPSHYGQEVAFSLARDLSLRGVSIVSGLARGIDTQAHRGALKGVAKTVAVLGSGIDIVYPQENKTLAEEIVGRGALVSEFPPGTPPQAENFPRRNRVIAGLSAGAIIVEATERSGAMITARHALEQGRLCMAVPGAITNARSRGPHSLLRQGALLVEQADDVLQEIAPQLAGGLAGREVEQGESGRIVEAIAGTPLSIEEIAQVLEADVAEVTRSVTLLELRGEIMRGEGNRFTVRRRHG